MSLRDFIIMQYIPYYEVYILIFWSVFLLVYFSISYKLYKNKEFYLFVLLFLLGLYIFNYLFPNDLVSVQKQRIRYLDLAYNFYKYGIFAHIVNGKFIDVEIHLTYCSIPVIFSIFLFGPISAFKFTLWYTVFSLLVMSYLGYKLYKSENKTKLLIFSFLLIFPFVYYEFLNPYNYPEFSNALLFSIFSYLMLNKKDDRAFLILPLLLSSGNEYIFFFVFMPFILRFLDVKNYVKKTLIYYIVSLFVAFPYIYLTFSQYIFGELKYFFNLDAYLNTLREIKRSIFLYLPFITFFVLSFYLLFLYLFRKDYIKTLFIIFYFAFIIIISGWGVTSYDYLYPHYLPNLLPIILFLSRDLERETIFIVSTIYLILIISFHDYPFIFKIVTFDNLSSLLAVADHVPRDSLLLFPRPSEIEYLNLLGLDLTSVYTFFDIQPNLLNNTYYFVTTEFVRNMKNWNFDKVHNEILRFCNLTFKYKQWEIYKCKGYDENVANILNVFRSQNFG